MYFVHNNFENFCHLLSLPSPEVMSGRPDPSTAPSPDPLLELSPDPLPEPSPEPLLKLSPDPLPEPSPDPSEIRIIFQ